MNAMRALFDNNCDKKIDIIMPDMKCWKRDIGKMDKSTKKYCSRKEINFSKKHRIWIRRHRKQSYLITFAFLILFYSSTLNFCQPLAEQKISMFMHIGISNSRDIILERLLEFKSKYEV